MRSRREEATRAWRIVHKRTSIGPFVVGSDGRKYMELPEGRDPVERAGETIIDRLAADHQRRKRAEQAREKGEA